MKINNLKCLSLFDGISGCQQALKNLGIEYEYYASEVDRFAIQITQNNFPNTIQLGCVKELRCLTSDAFGGGIKILRTRQGVWHQELNGFDLLCGGSPCQDLSIAKKDRKGLDGERSGLFYEYVRILNEVKPKFFILENVASMSKESKELISKELFNIEPILINSSLLVAQQRKRLYWIGKLQEDGTYKKVEIPQPEDKELLLKDILEVDVDEKYYLSDKMIKYITSCGSKNYKLSNGKFNPEKAYPLTRTMASCHRLGIDTYIKDDKGIRKLTPIECEKLQGFPVNYTEGIANTNRYKALGNSFTVPVIEHILKAILYETK